MKFRREDCTGYAGDRFVVAKQAVKDVSRDINRSIWGSGETPFLKAQHRPRPPQHRGILSGLEAVIDVIVSEDAEGS
jgi:hypothetical protein